MSIKKVVTYEVRCDMCGMLCDPASGSTEKPVMKYRLITEEGTTVCDIDLCYKDKDRLLSALELICGGVGNRWVLLSRRDEAE